MRATNRINKMGKNGGIILNKTEIQCPVFVDDIIGMGGKVEVEDVGDKMNGLEKTKKFQSNRSYVYITKVKGTGRGRRLKF